MKSALELAMEKADEAVGRDEEYAQLTPEQVAEIAEIKERCQARWAEQEIILRGRMQAPPSGTDPQEYAAALAQVQEEATRVREQIFAERDAKIEAVRQQARAGGKT